MQTSLKHTPGRLAGLCFIFLFTIQLSFTQRVAISAEGLSPDPSAMLHVMSDSLGMLVPNLILNNALTAAPVNNPATGLLIYNGGGAEPDGFYYWDGVRWQPLIAGRLAVLSDADGDTKIEVDDGTDPDTIVFKVAGTRILQIAGHMIEPVNNGQSVFLGAGAGEHDDLTGNKNTFAGFQAGQLTTSGEFNVAMGYTALRNNTTGSNNTAVGSKALLSNTQGIANVALGNALKNNLTGNENTALGFTALNANSSGSENIAIGAGALRFNSLGNRNAIIGYEADAHNTQGNANTILGYQAGHGVLPHSKSGNVFLGHRAGYNETGSNKLYIHNDSVFTPLIYGEFDQGLLRVNGKMEVKGEIVIEDSGSPFPVAGTVRWNAATEDFEGYDGNKWMSLTGQTVWGQNAALNAYEDASLVASDGTTNDFFGYTVAISGDYAIVGAYHHTVGGNAYQGKAYIFYRSGNAWSEQDTLIASDGAAGDAFGCSVSISGDYAIIGANGWNASHGKAYIFHRSGATWNEQDTLTATDGAASDKFGSSVGISGDYAIVGAYAHNTGGNNDQGKAYIFYRTGLIWIQQDTLIASDGAANDWFGLSVGISGDHTIVGAHRHDVGGNTDQGKVYIFHRVGPEWSVQDTLVALDGSAYDYFGYAVAIAEDFSIVGSVLHDVGSNSAQGKAYIFRLSGEEWIQHDMLVASDGAENDWFGYSVGIFGDYVIVGAPEHDTGGNSNQGKAYIFHRFGQAWSEQSILVAADGNAYDEFGCSASISGEYTIIGAFSHAVDGNSNQGKAYLYNKN